MQRFVISLFLILSTLAGAAEFRTWSNPDKTKSFEAEFVSRKDDRVTVRLKNFKTITLEISKLHIDDQLWIKQNKSVATAAAASKNIKQVDEDAVFDTVVFGDNRDTVTKKLFASKLVTSNVALAHIGRTGLNNIFTTREKVAGLACSLTFDWSESGELIELTLQSEDRSAQAYSSDLKKCLEEFEELLTTIYGKPKQSSAMSKISELTDEQMLASHVWRLDQGGSILLGTSKMNGSYQTVVRFTKEAF
ncbi:MAG: hypothetical protein V4727_03000 [Verrucomicrobiota bacterium]